MLERVNSNKNTQERPLSSLVYVHHLKEHIIVLLCSGSGIGIEHALGLPYDYMVLLQRAY